MTLRVHRASRLSGALSPPPDKSLTHRAYLLAAIANSPSFVDNPLCGDDCASTLDCLRKMGLRVESEGSGVRLTPAPEWLEPNQPLNCGNSGTTMRLLSGLIASRPLEATLIGDASLSRRPMKRIAEPLRLMGATVVGDTPPLRIVGGALDGIRYETPVASAQIKSAILLAGLRASGQTWVREPMPSRDHTERMLSATGVLLTRQDGAVGVQGGSVVHGFAIRIPGDVSSAAFWLVASALLPGELELKAVGVNVTRTGVLDVLQSVGCEIESSDEREELGEPTATLLAVNPANLKSFTIEGALVPRLIDEIPVLAVLATQCEGTSMIRDARELRVKESDRIDTMARALTQMGAKIETFEDGMAIYGPTPLVGSRFDAAGDHRIAMSLAIAGLIADGETVIDGADSIQTSYPSFMEDLRAVANG